MIIIKTTMIIIDQPYNPPPPQLPTVEGLPSHTLVLKIKYLLCKHFVLNKRFHKIGCPFLYVELHMNAVN